MKTAQELLGAAVDIIERDGWHQGSLYEGSNEEWVGGAEQHGRHVELGKTAPVCAMGAVYRAAVGTAYVDSVIASFEMQQLVKQAMSLLTRAMCDQSAAAGRRNYGIASFNDDPRTSREDVVLAMKTAASS